MKPLGKIKIKWSAKFAYAIGLIVSDGNLSIDGRHIIFTSKDEQLAKNFKVGLGIKTKTTMKSRVKGGEKKYFVVQFGDVNFYHFLLSVGLFPNKSKTLGKLEIPKKYFYHFLRGCFDGDGNINEFRHPESKHLQLKIRIFSASRDFLEWIKLELEKDGVNCFWQKGQRVWVLTFAKKESIMLLHLIYFRHRGILLTRKAEVAKKYMPGWRNGRRACLRSRFS